MKSAIPFTLLFVTALSFYSMQVYAEDSKFNGLYVGLSNSSFLGKLSTRINSADTSLTVPNTGIALDVGYTKDFNSFTVGVEASLENSLGNLKLTGSNASSSTTFESTFSPKYYLSAIAGKKINNTFVYGKLGQGILSIKYSVTNGAPPSVTKDSAVILYGLGVKQYFNNHFSGNLEASSYSGSTTITTDKNFNVDMEAIGLKVGLQYLF